MEPRRGQWMERARRSGVSKGAIWYLTHALPAQTAADATSALDASKTDPRLSFPTGFLGMERGDGERESADAVIGHVYLLAGRPADAIPYLQRAVKNCFILLDPFTFLRAEIDLARILGQQGDIAGACAGYGRVIARWGAATPRSVTAETARDEAARLGCK